MLSINTILSGLSGYRTYLAAAATILTAIATAAGLLCPASGVAVGATCLALAAICQRLATANNLSEVLAALEELKAGRDPNRPAPEPTLLGIFPDRSLSQ